MKPLYIMTILLFLSGCSTLGPIGTLVELGEASNSQQEVDETPSTIETVVTNDNGKIIVESSSDKSMVIGEPQIINPEMKPQFNTQRAFDAIPLWLQLIAGLSGILYIINSLRYYYNNKKRGEL